MFFAADIGATNSRFALFSAHTTGDGDLWLKLEREQWLAGADFASFPEAMHALLHGSTPFLQSGEHIHCAVLALAGPITGDVCRISNLPWTVRKDDICKAFATPSVFFINDFMAQGYACLAPELLEIFDIQTGRAVAEAPIAVIGAGTGLGKALLLPPEEHVRIAQPENHTPLAQSKKNADATRPETADTNTPEHLLQSSRLAKAAQSRVLASEGGHADFPFSVDEHGFAEFLQTATGKKRLIGDMVISGSGLGHLFAYLTGKRLPDTDVPDAVSAHPEALDWFARFYGRACRNFALENLALGGVYITGGMALRVPVLTHPAFLEEFHNSAAHKQLLQNMPVRHIHSHSAGLWGAALYAALRSGISTPRV